MRFILLFFLVLAVFAKKKKKEEKDLRRPQPDLDDPEYEQIDPRLKVDGIVDLTEETWNDTVDGTKNVMVYFYASKGCPSCNLFAYTIKKIGDVFYSDEFMNSRMTFAKIDVSVYKDTGEKYIIDDPPRLILFNRGTNQELFYPGSMDYDSILDFCHKIIEDDVEGRIPKLDEIAVKFMVGNRKRNMKKVEEYIANLGPNDEYEAIYAQYYLLVMKMVEEKGDDWVNKEMKRLRLVLKNHKRTVEQLRAIAWKLNILDSFYAD